MTDDIAAPVRAMHLAAALKRVHELHALFFDPAGQSPVVLDDQAQLLARRLTACAIVRLEMAAEWEERFAAPVPAAVPGAMGDATVAEACAELGAALYRC